LQLGREFDPARRARELPSRHAEASDPHVGKRVEQILGHLVDQGHQSHRRILRHRDEHVESAIPEADYYSRVMARRG
jgi:hypothetical protein